MELKSLKDTDRDAWDDFVYNHPNANFFQTTRFYDLYENFKESRPVGYAIVNETIILGVIVGIIYQNYSWPLSILTRRAIIMGGPLVLNNSSEVFDFLVQNFCEREKKNCTFIQIRNLWDIKSEDFNFEKFEFSFQNHLNILHDLTLEEKVLLNKISKSKQANIRKSVNKGTLVKEIETSEDFRTGVDFIISTYSKIGLPCPSLEFFINVYNNYRNQGFIKSFGAYDGKKLIAMRIEICYKDKIYDWYTGHLPEFNNRYPNDILPYNVMLWGKRNGYTLFDFGGAGKPNVAYGVREHKMKFGGSLVDLGRYEKINNKLLMYVFKLGYYFIKKK